MPAAASKKAAAPKAKANHVTYQDMISEAIVTLKDRNGSSRQALKKYVKANNTVNVASDAMFDALFNKALKAGVEKGVFEQPKGPSGGTKLAKKKPEVKKPAAAATPAPAPKKETKVEKKPATKAAAKPAAKKAAAPKKAAAAPKKAAAKVVKKAPAKKAAAPKKAAPVKKTADKPEKPETVLTKTKSGRVTKTQKPPAAPKRAAPKKAAPKKAAAKA